MSGLPCPAIVQPEQVLIRLRDLPVRSMEYFSHSLVSTTCSSSLAVSKWGFSRLITPHSNLTFSPPVSHRAQNVSFGGAGEIVVTGFIASIVGLVLPNNAVPIVSIRVLLFHASVSIVRARHALVNILDRGLIAHPARGNVRADKIGLRAKIFGAWRAMAGQTTAEARLSHDLLDRQCGLLDGSARRRHDCVWRDDKGMDASSAYRSEIFGLTSGVGGCFSAIRSLYSRV